MGKFRIEILSLLCFCLISSLANLHADPPRTPEDIKNAEERSLYGDFRAGDDFPLLASSHFLKKDEYLPDLRDRISDYSGNFIGTSVWKGDRRYDPIETSYQIKIDIKSRFDMTVDWRCEQKRSGSDHWTDASPKMFVENAKFGMSPSIWGDMYFISGDRQKRITRPFLALFVKRRSDDRPGLLLLGMYEEEVFLARTKEITAESSVKQRDLPWGAETQGVQMAAGLLEGKTSGSVSLVIHIKNNSQEPRSYGEWGRYCGISLYVEENGKRKKLELGQDEDFRSTLKEILPGKILFFTIDIDAQALSRIAKSSLVAGGKIWISPHSPHSEEYDIFSSPITLPMSAKQAESPSISKGEDSEKKTPLQITPLKTPSDK